MRASGAPPTRTWPRSLAISALGHGLALAAAVAWLRFAPSAPHDPPRPLALTVVSPPVTAARPAAPASALAAAPPDALASAAPADALPPAEPAPVPLADRPPDPLQPTPPPPVAPAIPEPILSAAAPDPIAVRPPDTLPPGTLPMAAPPRTEPTAQRPIRAADRPHLRPQPQPPGPVPAPAAAPAPATADAAPGGNSSARAIVQPKPEIPDELRHRQLSAVAVVRFHVARDGTAEVELVEATAEPRLNQAILAACRQWRFFPAMRQGAPADDIVVVRLPIRVE